MSGIAHAPLLGGLKVIDCSTVFAGPAAAAYLADYGAEVIKVEHPKGDHARSFEPVHNDISLWCKLVNRNKLHMTLDLHDDQAREIFKRLAAQADVVIENFRPGTLQRWGIGYDELSRLNPGLVMLHVTAFGQTGPYSDRPGYGTLAEAMSGMAQLIGYPDRPPLLPPLALGDNIGAIAGAFAVMAALFNRQQTGQGQEIDLALVEPLLAVLGIQTLVRDITGESLMRNGNRVNHLAPRGAWETADKRWISVTVGNDNTFKSLTEAMGMPELFVDERFSSNRARLKNVDEIEEIMADWFSRTSFFDAIKLLENHNVAHAPLYDAEQLLEDPQLKYRNAFVSVPDEELGTALLPNLLVRFSKGAGQVRHAGQPKGAHNAAILREKLGLSDSEIKALQEREVI